MTKIKQGTYIARVSGEHGLNIYVFFADSGKSFPNDSHVFMANELTILTSSNLGQHTCKAETIHILNNEYKLMSEDDSFYKKVKAKNMLYQDLVKHFVAPFNEYMIKVWETMRRYPQYRLGQTMFNVAQEMTYNVELVRGTQADPFYNNKLIPAFIFNLWGEKELNLFKETDSYAALAKKGELPEVFKI